MSSIIEIDGSIGGGSVLRLGVPLAIALGKSLRVTNVRQLKKRRGLQVQHLVGLNFLSQLTGSQLMGASIGSSEVYLTPGNSPPPTNFLPKIQVPTAAAVSLIIQMLSNYVFASRKSLAFEFDGGGTHIAFSPNFDVLLQVNQPIFELFGVRLHIQLGRPGFFPQGGASGRIFIEPIPFSKVILTSGEVTSVEVISSAETSLRSQKIAEKQISGFKSVIYNPNKVFAGYSDALNPGFACSAIIKYKGNSLKGIAQIGNQSISPEENGKQTGIETKKAMKNPASVDEQLADQLILPLAFSPSGSRYSFDKMYPHVKTNIEVIKAILGDILDLKKENDLFILTRI